MDRNKWDTWAAIFWLIAVLSIPVAVYFIAKLGFVHVPRFTGSYSTRPELNLGMLLSGIALVVSAFFAAAFFSLVNDIYKRTFEYSASSKNSESASSDGVKIAGVRVKEINEGSPLESKVKVGWRLVAVNDELIHRSGDVSFKLNSGKNNLRFLVPGGGVENLSVNLDSPPRLGILLD